jgi:hypothetical protein
MKETLEQLKLIRDEYQKKVDALNTAIDLLSVDHPDVCTPAENEHNVVIQNEPFDFSSIPDWNGNKKGGIRNDD